MDLRTIKSRIKEGGIRNVDEFERDVLLMFANAMLYNEPTTEVHRMAEEVSLEIGSSFASSGIGGGRLGER